MLNTYPFHFPYRYLSSDFRKTPKVLKARDMENVFKTSWWILSLNNLYSPGIHILDHLFLALIAEASAPLANVRADRVPARKQIAFITAVPAAYFFTQRPKGKAAKLRQAGQVWSYIIQREKRWSGGKLCTLKVFKGKGRAEVCTLSAPTCISARRAGSCRTWCSNTAWPPWRRWCGSWLCLSPCRGRGTGPPGTGRPRAAAEVKNRCYVLFL